MTFPRIEGALRAWAKALALVVLALPLFNPDLFWHLNAGRWIWAAGSVPRTEPFSFTKPGAPWLDFEWLFQVLVYAVHSASGMWGLLLLKAALLGTCFLPIDALLRARGVGAGARALALAFWSACVLPQSDLRPDLFSLLFFSMMLCRLDRDEFSWKLSLPLFALWSNLHAGFALGLCLYAAKAGSLLLEGRRPPAALGLEAAAAALGTLLNPLGLAAWQVAALHAGQVRGLSRYIQEWGPLSPRAPLQWPLTAALLAFAAGAWRGRRRLPLFLAFVSLPLALACALCVRFGLFFAAAGAALLFAPGLAAAPRRFAPALALLTALVAIPLSRVAWGTPFNDAYVARRAAEFVVREGAALDGLRLFNTYEWGGYLGWLRPGRPVFGDGRYLFAEQLPEIEAALRSASSMEAFVARHRLDGLLIRNHPQRLASTRLYQDGSRREFLRPWHLYVLPRARWALVYFDRQALLFVDRAKVPAAWLEQHEFRLLRPGDEDALADAVARGEVDLLRLQAESRRLSAPPR